VKLKQISRVQIAKLVVGGLVLALVVNSLVSPLFCPTASEQANAITMDDVQKTVKGIETSRRQQELLDQFSAAPFGSAEREKKLTALIDTLEPDAQIYVRSQPRSEQLNAITKKLREEGDALSRELQRQETQQKLCNLLCWWR
jgi:hypothetical protein